jgi:hypothetical protein
MAVGDATVMPLSKGRRAKQQKNGPMQRAPQDPQRTWWTPLHRAYVGFAVVATFLGAIAAVVTLLPHISVDPFGPFDPSSSSPTFFDISNTGPIPLQHIQPMLGICALKYKEKIRVEGKCPRVATLD